MAAILRNYGIARENGFFKLEQEAEVQRHRQRLKREGKLDDCAAAGEGGSGATASAAPGGFDDSLHAYEVLPEVLQQQARVDDPGAAARQE